MTSHNEAQKIDDEYLGLAHEAGWYSPDDLVIPYSVFVEVLTPKHEAQKTKADWLRSEIEKLEGMLELTTDKDSDNAWAFKVHKNKTLTSITSRYKEELKVLESK